MPSVYKRNKNRRELDMKWFWFSFSFGGMNQGCCIVQAQSQEEALQKTIDLRIHPRHDDIQVWIGEHETQPELEINRLYSSKEMVALGYQTQVSTSP